MTITRISRFYQFYKYVFFIHANSTQINFFFSCGIHLSVATGLYSMQLNMQIPCIYCAERTGFSFTTHQARVGVAFTHGTAVLIEEAIGTAQLAEHGLTRNALHKDSHRGSSLPFPFLVVYVSYFSLNM